VGGVGWWVVWAGELQQRGDGDPPVLSMYPGVGKTFTG
jgi:hypothetical protein